MSKHIIKATIRDRKGRVLSVGYNSYTKTHPEQARFARLAGTERKTYLHAEVAAIIRACRRRMEPPHSISIERFNSSGQPKLAKPCPICMLAIKEAGIKEVRYTVA